MVEEIQEFVFFMKKYFTLFDKFSCLLKYVVGIVCEDFIYVLQNHDAAIIFIEKLFESKMI